MVQGIFIGQGVSWEQELLEQYRTLSPSDFGFHNALRTPAGTMVFLDFEYFGWDDPAKTGFGFFVASGDEHNGRLEEIFCPSHARCL